MSFLALSLTFGLLTGSTIHTPHAETSSIAIAPLSGGGTEMVLVSRLEAKVLHSYDDGLTWHPVAGANLGKTMAARVVYYPRPSPRFIIATDQGVWSYWNETGVVEELNTGIDPADRFLVDLAAPIPGEDGPVVIVNDNGVVYSLDETTDSWTNILTLSRFDRNPVVAVAPRFDRSGLPGPNQTILVGVRGTLVTSQDAGLTWVGHPQFDTPAIDVYDYHITALAMAEDYVVSGVIMLGRAKRDDTYFTGSRGELWRSNDFGANFVQQSPFGSPTLDSGVYHLLATPVGPDGNRHFFASLFWFPEANLLANSLGVLRSDDVGMTWSDQGTAQDFIGEFSQNLQTASDIAYRRMMQVSMSPDYATDGRLWYARAEALYRTRDNGSSWTRLRFRPTSQVRGLATSVGMNGDIYAFGSTYGAGLVRYNRTQDSSLLMPYEELIYYACMETSPNYTLDGISAAGGAFDLGIMVETPNKKNWYFVNEMRQAIDGPTGYVRSISFSPNFGGFNVPGADQAFIWSSRFEGSPLGENRLTLDGLANVTPINDVFGLPGQRAPFMHVLHLADGFDPVNLPAENGIFGMSRTFNQVYRLVNSGDAVTPVFEWQVLPWAPTESLQDCIPDPRYMRPGNASLWVLGTENLYHLKDLSSDWSNLEITTYPGVPGYQALALAISPDMNLFPSLYAATWGGGVFKLDLSASTPSWTSVGVGFPMSWGNAIELSPDFLNDRLIFVGTQDGIYHCQDLPGASWNEAVSEYALDSHNPSFRYYSPNDPSNPDPSRPWGWEARNRKNIPDAQLDKTPVYGQGVAYGNDDGDFAEFYFTGSEATVMTFKGPAFGDMYIEVEDEATGAQVMAPVTVSLFATKLGNLDIPLVMPGPGAYQVRLTAILGLDEVMALDAVRIKR